MAKVKGGLGETTLIEDLSKPISFHISESLEPPPIFSRKAKSAEKNEDEIKNEGKQSLSVKFILSKAANILDTNSIQVIFRFSGKANSLLLENPEGRNENRPKIMSIVETGVTYSYVDWDHSSFSGIEPDSVISCMADLVTGIEVNADGKIIKFADLDDFYEWLE